MDEKNLSGYNNNNSKDQNFSSSSESLKANYGEHSGSSNEENLSPEYESEKFKFSEENVNKEMRETSFSQIPEKSKTIIKNIIDDNMDDKKNSMTVTDDDTCSGIGVDGTIVDKMLAMQRDDGYGSSYSSPHSAVFTFKILTPRYLLSLEG
ncbi:hypothetical protein Phum_PHUM228020 [Pediculus humanus corporis]|uniref:Uncharacterized protein n=1 Tax=Pediculus humanus subsp. corporis TaxID=121224 RepID=E0VII9_PEDHC|nr:uncharacterized protein Phum_PHUM228020 [Pediculus humanus corporis]EEB13195.1 hypothetical protein Phum_PHUM228020 [Pediculus humanus corporis]